MKQHYLGLRLLLVFSLLLTGLGARGDNFMQNSDNYTCMQMGMRTAVSDKGNAISNKETVLGRAWRLPTFTDWQHMFIGCGNGAEYISNITPDNVDCPRRNRLP